jgi:hypothetical protein
MIIFFYKIIAAGMSQSSKRIKNKEINILKLGARDLETVEFLYSS